MNKVILLLMAASLLQAQNTPRHLLGAKGPLTPPDGRRASEIAREFTARQAAEVGLNLGDLSSLYVDREYTDAHNGVTHIVYRACPI